MPASHISDHYCTIAEAARMLGCTDERIVRMLEQGEIQALINAEYDSVLGFKRCGYVVISPEVVLYITSHRCETVQFQIPNGKTAEATASLANIRVQMPSLREYIASHASNTSGNKTEQIILSIAGAELARLAADQSHSNFQAFPPPPGKMPRNANTIEAIEVAWELENELGRHPTCNEVMNRLCERAIDRQVTTVFHSPAKDKKSVRWTTSKQREKTFHLDCLTATLKKWYKSRGQNLNQRIAQ